MTHINPYKFLRLGMLLRGAGILSHLLIGARSRFLKNAPQLAALAACLLCAAATSFATVSTFIQAPSGLPLNGSGCPYGYSSSSVAPGRDGSSEQKCNFTPNGQIHANAYTAGAAMGVVVAGELLEALSQGAGYSATATAIISDTLFLTAAGSATLSFTLDGQIIASTLVVPEAANPYHHSGATASLAFTAFATTWSAQGLTVYGDSQLQSISTTFTSSPIPFDSTHPFSYTMRLDASALVAVLGNLAFPATQYRADASATFYNTAKLAAIFLTDSSGNPLSAQQAGLTSLSGFDYSFLVNPDLTATPEPATFVCAAAALACGVLLAKRRKRC